MLKSMKAPHSILPLLTSLIFAQLSLAEPLLVSQEREQTLERLAQLKTVELNGRNPSEESGELRAQESYLQVLETLLDPPTYLAQPEHLAPFVAPIGAPQVIDSDDRAPLLRALARLESLPFPFKPIHLYQLIRIARSLPTQTSSLPVSPFAGTQVADAFSKRLLDLGFPRQLKVTFEGGDALPRIFYYFTNSQGMPLVTFDEHQLGAGWSKAIDLVFDLESWNSYARALPNLAANPQKTKEEIDGELAILESFAFEAKILQRLMQSQNHQHDQNKMTPGLLEVHDVSKTQVIMKKYRCDLKKLIDGDALKQVPPVQLSINQKKQVFSQLLNGLTALHRDCDVVHKDIKFENILIDFDPSAASHSCSYAAVFADFGLSEDLTLYSKDFPATRLQSGTLHWFAPELLSKKWEGKDRDDKARLAKKTDVFGLGLVLHALFEGHKPAFTYVKFDERKAAIEKYLRAVAALPYFTLTDGLYLLTMTPTVAARASASELQRLWEQVMKVPNLGQPDIKRDGRLFLRNELLEALQEFGIQNLRTEEDAHRYLAQNPKAQFVLWPYSAVAKRRNEFAEIAVTLRQELGPIRTKILRSIHPGNIAGSVQLNLYLLERLSWLELPGMEDSSCTIL